MQRLTSLCAGLAACALAVCAPARGAVDKNAAGVVVVDDGAQGQGNFHFLATGRWERVRGHHDGRFGGTSTRSMHRGDVLVLTFSGTGVRLDAVVAPTNGYALVGIDDTTPEVVDFYAPRLLAHVPVWRREGLADDVHVVTIAVLGRHRRASHGDYVNVDDAQIRLGAAGRAR